MSEEALAKRFLPPRKRALNRAATGEAAAAPATVKRQQVVSLLDSQVPLGSPLLSPSPTPPSPTPWQPTYDKSGAWDPDAIHTGYMIHRVDSQMDSQIDSQTYRQTDG